MHCFQGNVTLIVALMGVDNSLETAAAAAGALSALCSAQALIALTTCRSGLVVVGGAFDSRCEACACGY